MKYQWAVCQHPMTLIIKEDETALERIPPFGAEDFHAYYLKIKENLDYLKNHKFAKVCFETSILETLFVLDEYPEIKNEFLSLLKDKKISFVGGTYGQAHLQTLTSESNFRQFEEGLKKYKELFNADVKLYAVQEPGHHEQMPQLLNAFDIKYSSLPAFTYSLIFLEPYELVSFMEIAWMKFTKERGMEQDQITRLCFTKDNEFARWVGIDGSEIPLYLIDPMRWCRAEDIRNEYKKDLYGSPNARLYLTDLLDFNPEIVKETLEKSEFILADEVIEKRYRELSGLKNTNKNKLGPAVRLYSYYSYLEGSKGDMAYIENRMLENLLIQAQALESYVILNKSEYAAPVNWDPFWRVILETQHHDVCYTDAPLLQKWAVAKIDRCIKEISFETDKLKESLKKHLVEDIEVKNENGPGNIILFNSEPLDIQSIAEVEVSGDFNTDDLILKDTNKKNIDFQLVEENNERKIVFIGKVNGFGIKTLKLVKDSGSSTGNKTLIGENNKFKKGKIENKFYICDVNESGEMSNIYLKNSGKTIFKELANKLSAGFNDERSIEFKADSKKFKHETGKIFDTVFSEGYFDKSTYSKEIRFYKNLPRIDFKISFNFNNQQVGNVFLEETKLCTTWPVRDLKKIHHDIPFGVVEGMKSRPLYCLNWINCELENDVSFTLLPKGKIKFFEKNGTLYNLLAWGDEGVDFMRVGGTCAPEILEGHFDLHLNGNYCFEYSLYLHDKKPQNSALFKLAASYNRPLAAFYSDKQLRTEEDIVFKFNNKNIASTAVFYRNNKARCRFFECNGGKSGINIENRKDIEVGKAMEISGAEVSDIRPFKIVQVDFSRKF